ncbi:MAG: hypothetical protein ACJASL_001482 [Paraglaciecola sp.]|jgi:hypothetical protein
MILELLVETLKVGRCGIWPIGDYTALDHQNRNVLPLRQFLSSMIVIVVWLMLNEFRRNGAKRVLVVLLKF